MLLLLLHVLLNVLELLLVASKLMLMTGLRKVAHGIIEAVVAMWNLHLSAIYLNWATIDAVLTRVSRDHLLLHGP